MRWSKKKDKLDGWKPWFALFPTKIGKQWIWLEPYWKRFEGTYTNVRLWDE